MNEPYLTSIYCGLHIVPREPLQVAFSNAFTVSASYEDSLYIRIDGLADNARLHSLLAHRAAGDLTYFRQPCFINANGTRL
jgi:hypothetical protein